MIPARIIPFGWGSATPDVWVAYHGGHTHTHTHTAHSPPPPDSFVPNFGEGPCPFPPASSLEYLLGAVSAEAPNLSACAQADWIARAPTPLCKLYLSHDYVPQLCWTPSCLSGCVSSTVASRCSRRWPDLIRALVKAADDTTSLVKAADDTTALVKAGEGS